MPFRVFLTAMDPLGPKSAYLPALSITSLCTTSLMMRVRITADTPPSTPVDDEYPPPTFVQGVLLVLRIIKPKPRTPPSFIPTSPVIVTPTPPVTLPGPSRACVRRSLPRAKYVPPEKSLCQGVFTTLPFGFGQPGSGPRRSKRCREEGEDGWLDWLVVCRRKKRRAV